MDTEKALEKGGPRTNVMREIINDSGATAVALLLRGSTVHVANVGDSRAVLARRSADGTNRLEALDLSTDQKPDIPSETKRVEAAGGTVGKPFDDDELDDDDEEEPESRVWLTPARMVGLAMSRSLGDYPFKKIGVTAEPVMTTRDLAGENPGSFLLLATDGVWGVMSSQEAVDIVGAFLDGGGPAPDAPLPEDDSGCQRAADELVLESAARWKRTEGDYRDDISALVVRVDTVLRRGGSGMPGAPQ